MRKLCSAQSRQRGMGSCCSSGVVIMQWPMMVFAIAPRKDVASNKVNKTSDVFSGVLG